MRFGSRDRSLLGKHTMRLQLVALIDVTMFLLLYFMLASSFSADEKTLSSGLGVEGRRGKAGNLQTQVVQVTGENGLVAYRIGSRSVHDKAALESLLRLLPNEQGVVLRVSGGVPVEAAAGAIQAAKNAGFRRVSYVPVK